MKKTFLLIYALLVSSVIPALAENMFMVDNLAYNKLGGDSVEVISLQEYYGDNSGYITYSGSIEIPETIYYDGMQYRVTAIGEMAFGTSRDMASVTIPNTVTSIGSYAFSDCEGLTEITIPNSVTIIESWAFQVCTNVQSLTIGDGLSVINEYAFSGCSSLTKVVLGKNVTEIEQGAFSGCTNLSDINIPASVTSISQDAFYNCPLNYAKYDNALYLGNTDNPYYILIKPTDTSITSCKIHDDTRVINGWAFYGCSNLTTIVMGQSVTTIGSAAFSGCTNLQYATLDNAKYLGNENNPNYALMTLEGDLTSFTIPKTVMVVQNDASFANLEELQVEVGNPIYHSAGNCLIATASSTLVKGCKNSSIPTDNSLTTIGESAFYECSGLTSVTIPKSVCTIGDQAFYKCSGLTSVTFSESIKSIGDYAFYKCTGLTSITIPNSIISIGESAFASCSGLTSAVIGAKITPSTHGIVIGRSAFYGCSNMTSLTLCEGISTISYFAFECCSSIESIIIPNTVTRLLNHAFNRCSKITSVVIPESVTEYGGDLFHGCSNLTSIEWNVKYRGAHCFPYPFSGCNNVTSFTFGDNVEYIPNELCNGMSKVTSIYLPYGVKAIGRYAFNGTGITQIDIPYEVHEIGDGAFDCPNLEYARFSGMPPWLGSGVFNSNTIVYIPCGMLTDYEYSNFSGYNLQEEKMFDFNWSAESADEKKGSVEIIQDISCYDNTVIFEAIPASGYQFKEWNDGNTENPRTVAINEDIVYTAYFEAENNYTISVVTNNVEWGTVTGSGDYVKNTEVTVTAIPTDGYRFTHWNDCNTENPRIVQVTQDTTLTAYFATVFTDIQLKQTQLTLEVGDSYYLNTIIEPKDADKSKLVWSSSNEDIVSVNGCIATAYSIGTATITVSTEDNLLSATCEIVVVEEGQNTSDDVVVDPNDKSVEISWTPVEGAAYYVFVVYADESQVTKICTLTFNAWGFLTNIHFLPKKSALTPENNPFNFTVTGLEENTTYGYSMSSYNEDETLITSKAGQFTTTSNVTTGVETPYIASPDGVRKVLENGTIYILRNGAKYTVDGRRIM